MSKTEPATNSISEAIDRLRHLSQIPIQTGWRFCDSDLSLSEVFQPQTWHNWERAERNEKGHLAWAKGQRVRWFVQPIQIPPDLNGYPLQGLCLRLALTWWAELAQIFVDGDLVQEGDLFDCSTRLLLSSAVTPGDTITVVIRLISPGHDDGALVRSVCLYETLSPDGFPEPGFIADELDVLHRFLQTFHPEKLDILETSIAHLDWSLLSPSPPLPLSPSPFTAALVELHDLLLPLSPLLKQRTIKLLGHAHLDMAWLWSVEETWKAAERTFESVLKLQEEFPELIFCHSTPALYEWMEQNRPDLFRRIQQQVKAGRWEPIGGIWVEPELNLISGESIARQILYGQRYYQEKFGKTSPIAWLPDTFGFTWQLPQFLKQGGIDYFVTQKLRWNDTTQFPYDLFQWQAPDGTAILSLMSAPIGEGIDPVKMATYACDWEQKTGLRVSLWLPGVGDHGGGPTRDMLQLARRWGRSPFFPNLEFTTAADYLREIEAGVKTAAAQGEKENVEMSVPAACLPTWNSDLYLEFHRGCYTTHADQKRWNRRCEGWLYLAELYAAIAALTAQMPYPRERLETAWKHMLFNQFHDILPGSAIREVYVDAERSWQAAAQVVGIIDTALMAIAAQIRLPSPPHPDATAIVVLNPCNWERSAIVHTPLDRERIKPEAEIQHPWQVCDLNGRAVATSLCSVGKGGDCAGWELTFLAEQVPALGYRCFWFCPRDQVARSAAASQSGVGAIDDRQTLENEFLRVVVDPASGDLASVFDKINQREVLSGAGNQLQAFRDEGQYWDAWNIDPAYESQPLPAPELVPTPNLKGTGARFHNALVDQIQVQRRIGQSVFTQTYILERGSPLLKIATSVDWQERHVLVKAAFPLNLEADYATYETPAGVIQRPTQPESDREKAQWEVPAMQWADLGDDTYGVSLLNDCKYGYDCQPNQIRLTLLRGSEWPNPEADRGQHHFTYALYPHAGSWQVAQTVQHGYELNRSLPVVWVPAQPSTQGTLPPQGQFLHLGAENLILTAFKPAEDRPDEWILRGYECHGRQAELNFQSDLPLELRHPVDLLEQSPGAEELSAPTVMIQPWQVVSLAIAQTRKPQTITGRVEPGEPISQGD